MRSRLVWLVPFLVFAAGPALARDTPPVAARPAEVKPEAAGFSAEGIAKLDQALHAVVDEKKLSGVTTLIARHGSVVHRDAYGQRDIASTQPMQLDTIVRIYSMTKPVTGVAMMMLYEAGKWDPADPIAKHIPEFAGLQVYAGEGTEGTPSTQAPAHAPTMGELMTHTAGFTYGLFGRTPVDQLYQKAELFQSESLHAFIEKLTKLPLAYQPGTKWVYSVSADIQGYVVEKLSGQSLPEFMRKRIFEPLRMTDTGFSVPEAKLPRLATIYSWDPREQVLKAQPRDPEVSATPGLPQGGGGLYSTAGDYVRFAQMLLNGGELDGKRLLKKETVEKMRTNKLAESLLTGEFGLGGQNRRRPGAGFGYDLAVVDDPGKAGSPVGKGTFSWYGIAGTWFWVDPTNDIVYVGMIQRRGGAPGGPNLEQLSRELTIQALVDPKK